VRTKGEDIIMMRISLCASCNNIAWCHKGASCNNGALYNSGAWCNNGAWYNSGA